MRFLLNFSILLSCFVCLSSAATQTDSVSLVTISTEASATGAAALDLEDERAKCFQSCYQKYGNFKSCTRGKDKVVECWCNDSVDWVEREEDCVWDVCGVSAYNGELSDMKDEYGFGLTFGRVRQCSEAGL